MRCKKCNSNNCIKKGVRINKQLFYCKNCKKYFQLEYSYQSYKASTNDFIKKLLKEGCGVRSISRILNISTKTVLSRMLKISKQIKIPYFNKFGCKFEVDELFIKIANGKSHN
ncbi:transposase (fragment) [Tenacibaculum sediminilitoris]